MLEETRPSTGAVAPLENPPPASPASAISLRDVTKYFYKGDTRITALARITFDVRPGSFVSILGPSGCGKTTILNLIAGLEEPSAGSIYCGAAPVQGISVGIGYLTQHDTLLPWRTVEDNVRLPLDIQGQHLDRLLGRRTDAEARERVAWAVGLVGLSGFEHHLLCSAAPRCRPRTSSSGRRRTRAEPGATGPDGRDGMTASPISVLGVVQTAPAFDVPPDACDCHVHVFGPPAQFPFAAGRPYTPGVASVDDLLSLQRALHLSRVVITQASPYGADNSCLLDALRQLHPRARGVAVIAGATAEDALREMHEAGVRGARVNLESHGQRDPAAARGLMLGAASRAAECGWHVEIYATLPVIASLHDTILTLPAMVVVDHFGLAQAASGTGQPGFDALLSLLRRGRIYVKVSAAYRISEQEDYSDAGALARALIDANPGHVVWGTDWPHPGGIRGERRDPGRIEPFRPEDDGRALNRLRRWAPDPAQVRKILVENPARLYDF